MPGRRPTGCARDNALEARVAALEADGRGAAGSAGRPARGAGPSADGRARARTSPSRRSGRRPAPAAGWPRPCATRSPPCTRGWSSTGTRCPRRAPAELSPPRGAFIVGSARGARCAAAGSSAWTTRAVRSSGCTSCPKLRGRGVARALLHALEERARGLGYPIARLDTGPRQAGAAGPLRVRGLRRGCRLQRQPGRGVLGREAAVTRQPAPARGSRSRSCRRPGSGRRVAGGRRG